MVLRINVIGALLAIVIRFYAIYSDLRPIVTKTI
jgi:hypothetical protein